MNRTGTIAAALFLLAAPAASASEEILPPNLSGEWKGTGKVQKDEKAKPMNVKCSINGEQTPDKVGFGGECRALLVLKRKIGAELTIEGDRFTGTYIGSNAGPAKLDGTMTGPETLTLNMTFEREINGDDQAVMTIVRPDDNEFTITTVDRMISGEEVTTSQITFLRE